MPSSRRLAMPHFALSSFARLLSLAAVCAAIGSSPAGAAPVDRKTLAGQQAMFLQIELTQVGTREFGTVPKDSLTDAAYRKNRTLKLEVRLNMPIPGSPPPSLMAKISPAELSDQDRFVGWMASPDTEGAEETITSGKMDLAKSPMFLPARYAVDDVEHFRFRDQPTDGFGTSTTVTKGTGTIYAPVSGMLICDLKNLTCDIANIAGGFNDGPDKLIASTTSDVPGVEPKKDERSPSLTVPGISEALGKQLTGMTISLQDPFTKTFTAPGPGRTGGDSTDGTTVTMKVTLSSKSAVPAAAPAAKK
jgi:hypothetical protein